MCSSDLRQGGVKVINAEFSQIITFSIIIIFIFKYNINKADVNIGFRKSFIFIIIYLTSFLIYIIIKSYFLALTRIFTKK